MVHGVRYTNCIKNNKKLKIRIIEDDRLSNVADEAIVYFLQWLIIKKKKIKILFVINY